MFDLAQLLPEHFETLIGEPLPLVESGLVFTVGEVKRLSSPSPRGTPFCVTLRAPTGTQGRQGTYRLRHPSLGELAVFLVPVAPENGIPLFEAVFN